MPGLASPTTAEHVLGAIEAVVVSGGAADATTVAALLEITEARAKAALDMAVELGLLELKTTRYHVFSPLCRFCSMSDRKAAVLRIVIDTYEPFIKFRERLIATTDSLKAARETKIICQLTADRDEVKDTLISLGTFSHALVTKGAGGYQIDVPSLENSLNVLALSCATDIAAEGRIRDQLGPRAVSLVSRQDVIIPLADALIRARERDPEGAVQRAGNAVESHIDAMAARMGVALGPANGIVSKLQKFSAPPRKLPGKLIHVGSYLGAVRNAADHGVDTDINATWQIRDSTGIEYVFVACSFIATTVLIEQGQPAEI
jgi:hypothetical protein